MTNDTLEHKGISLSFPVTMSFFRQERQLYTFKGDFYPNTPLLTVKENNDLISSA